MTDPDRGAYTPPTEPPLTFDARRPTLTYRRPLPFILIISVLVLAALIGAVLWFYRGGIRGADDVPQPVGTPLGEIMAPAPDETGPGDPAAGLEVYKTDELSEGEPTFTPPPEQPKARPSTPVETTTLPPAGTTAPAPKTTPPPKAPPPAATGAFSVQIGAFSSQALADTGWNEAIGIGGGSGLGKSVEAVEVNGSTLYRTRVTGFTSRQAATGFCEQLKAAGKSCFVR